VTLGLGISGSRQDTRAGARRQIWPDSPVSDVIMTQAFRLYRAARELENPAGPHDLLHSATKNYADFKENPAIA
jgi:hypothetical protein